MSLLEDFFNDDTTFNETQEGDNDIINYGQNVAEEPIILLQHNQHLLVTAIIKKFLEPLPFVICFLAIRELIAYLVYLLVIRYFPNERLDNQMEGEEEEEGGDQEEREEGDEEVFDRRILILGNNSSLF